MGEADRKADDAWSFDQSFRSEPGDRRDARPEFPGSELLVGSSPREIAARITPGDPLGFAGRCEARLRERALLVAPNRLLPRALARTARAAMSYRGTPPLANWLSARVDQAIEDCLLEDREDEHAHRPATDPRDSRYAFVAEVWGVPPAVARAACIVFNDLPSVVRRAWWALTVEGKSINRYVAEGHGPPQRVEARVKRAIQAMSLLRDPGGEDPDDQEEPLDG